MASQPIDTDPDWQGIRAASVAVGVREAARQASSHLPAQEQDRFVERVMKRCSREGWLTHAKASIQAVKGQAMPLSAPVRTGAQIIENTLLERKERTKLGLSKWSAKAAETLGDLDGENALAAHQAAVGVASVLSKVYPEAAQDNSVHLAFFSISQERPDESGPVVDV